MPCWFRVGLDVVLTPKSTSQACVGEAFLTLVEDQYEVALAVEKSVVFKQGMVVLEVAVARGISTRD